MYLPVSLIQGIGNGRGTHLLEHLAGKCLVVITAPTLFFFFFFFSYAEDFSSVLLFLISQDGT